MSLQKVGRRKADSQPHVEPKERILKSARQLFEEKGYAGVAIRDILKAAQVTQPTLYYHFGDKKGLYKAVVIEIVENILLELNQIGQNILFETQLIEILNIFYRYRRTSVGTMLYEMAAHEDFGVEDLEQVGKLVNQGWRPTIERRVRDAMRRGELRRRNATFYTQIIFEMGFSFARSPLGNWTGWDEARQIDEIATLLLNGFGVEQKSSSI